MNTALPLAAALLALSPVAMADEGEPKVREFGFVAEGIVFGAGSDRTEPGARRPANLVCAGVMGQRREGFKLGVELLGCGGDRRRVGGLYGGTRLHFGGNLGPFRLGGGAGVGLGGLSDTSDLAQGSRWSTFLYVKPGLTAGFQLWGVGVDIEAFAFLPIHLLQVVGGEATPYTIANAGAGARVNVMFGKSPKRVREEQEAAEEAQRQKAALIRAQREAEEARRRAAAAEAAVEAARVEAAHAAEAAALAIPAAPAGAPAPAPQPAPPPTPTQTQTQTANPTTTQTTTITIVQPPAPSQPLAIPAGPGGPGGE